MPSNHWFRAEQRGGVCVAMVPILLAAGFLCAAARGADPPAAGDSAGIKLEYVPPESVIVAAARPAALFEQEGMRPLANLFNQQMELEKLLGLPVQDIEQITAIMVQPPGPPPRGGGFERMIIRSRRPHDWQTAVKLVARGEPVPAMFQGRTYNKPAKDLPGIVQYCSFVVDDRTLLIAHEPHLQQMIAPGRRPEANAEWSERWRQVAKGEAAVMVNVAVMFKAIEEARNNEPLPPPLAPFAPLWENTQTVIAAARLGRGMALEANAVCPTPQAAQKVLKTLEAMSMLARNALDSLGKMATEARGEAAAGGMLIASDLGTELLNQLDLSADGATVVLSSRAEFDAGDTIATMLAPAADASRRSAQRAQSSNNLKQLGIAMYAYHDVHGKLPAPVLMGPDGKTPHSWRVALLPFLEQKPLYDQYKLDEPWDSEHNRKVLEKMPDLYRSPTAEAADTSAAYFALSGPATLFDGEGTAFNQILDGASNTIMLVEAKRGIPWTKPEDLGFDPAKPLPKLGGYSASGFLVLFADGSVRFIAADINEDVLRGLFTKAGGEPNLLR